MKGFLAKPKTTNKLGCVLVIHENRGLNQPIIDVTKRVAAEGYISIGIDALSPFGGTPTDEEDGRTLISKLDPGKNLQNYLKGLDYLRNRKDGNGKAGCVGFCWGGAMVNKLAVNDQTYWLLLLITAHSQKQRKYQKSKQVSCSTMVVWMKG